MNNTVFTFLLILSSSFVFSLFMSRIPLLRIPATVSYLLYGMVLQTGIIPLTPSDVDWISQLAAFGLLFLMFISGLEVDVRQLRPSSWAKGIESPLVLSLSVFFSTLLLSYVASVCITLAFPKPANPYMIALLLSTTSLSVILPILEESGRTHTNYGQSLLLCALFADFLTMVLLSMFISRAAGGGASDVAIAFFILPVMGGIYLLLKWAKKWAFFRRLAGDAKMRVRGIVALLAAACAFAEFTGAEPILGSFLVGMLVSALPFALKSTIRDYSHGLGYGFLIPVFFLSVGLDFRLDAFDHGIWVWIPILLIVSFLVKLLPAWQLSRHYGRRQATAGGFLLSARLSLVAAAAEIGVSIHAIPQILADMLLVVAVASSLIAPILFLTIAEKMPVRTG